MLSCENLTVRVSNMSKPILTNACVEFKPYAMNAVIGPSGCGKTTLLKAMMKLIKSEGNSYFCGEKISKSEDLIGKVGYAPQFTAVQPKFTVREALENALLISVGFADDIQIEKILDIVGLSAHQDKLVESLSGGQLRRIGLAVELANDPMAIFCDEVTSGLDPLSENSILDMLKGLCANKSKTFICIIHNLAKLDYFDLISVVYEGEVVFQGSLPELKEHFEIDNALMLYDVLNSKPIEYWRAKSNVKSPRHELIEYDFSSYKKPSWCSQFLTLLSRRVKLFFRDTTYLILTLAITFGFPVVVVIFALNGLPQIEGMALDRSIGGFEELQLTIKTNIEAANVATLVTGLILFQVVLLALMASNDSAREISGERNLYEKERLIGLRPSVYAMSKATFVSGLALFQGFWMCFFVKTICDFPGSFVAQCIVLSALTISMAIVCLGFSAIFSTAEKSSIVSIYLVGFQLPLSGVVLALPEYFQWICRPFISTYWAWAGYMSSMRNSRIYDAYIQTQTNWDWIPSPYEAFFVLILQAVIFGFFMIFIGCNRKSQI